MNRLFGILVAVCVLSAFTVDAQAKIGIKVSGGILSSALDETLFGVTMSKDIPFTLWNDNMAISPFVDVFYKSDHKLFDGGVNLIYNLGSGDGVNIYFGGGGGIVHESLDSERVRGDSSLMTGAISSIAGIEFGSSDGLSFFLQGKWIYAFEVFTYDENDPGNHFVIQAGISF